MAIVHIIHIHTMFVVVFIFFFRSLFLALYKTDNWIKKKVFFIGLNEFLLFKSIEKLLGNFLLDDDNFH